MAVQRPIKTSMWNDPRFSELDASEKLLVLHLFTNERTTLSGIYSITLRLISFETWFNQDELRKLFARLQSAGIAVYFEDLNYVYFRKFIEYQAHTNFSIQTGIDRELNGLMPEVRARVLEYGHLDPTLPPGWSTLLNLTLLNLTQHNSTEILPISDDSVQVPKELKPVRKDDSELFREYFDIFWSVYPRKGDKKKALINFTRALKNWVHFETIISWAKAYSLSCKWKELKYIKLPTTRLNGENREDEAIGDWPPVTDIAKIDFWKNRVRVLTPDSPERLAFVKACRSLWWDDVRDDIRETYNASNR